MKIRKETTNFSLIRRQTLFNRLLEEDQRERKMLEKQITTKNKEIEEITATCLKLNKKEIAYKKLTQELDELSEQNGENKWILELITKSEPPLRRLKQIYQTKSTIPTHLEELLQSSDDENIKDKIIRDEIVYITDESETEPVNEPTTFTTSTMAATTQKPTKPTVAPEVPTTSTRSTMAATTQKPTEPTTSTTSTMAATTRKLTEPTVAPEVPTTSTTSTMATSTKKLSATLTASTTLKATTADPVADMTTEVTKEITTPKAVTMTTTKDETTTRTSQAAFQDDSAPTYYNYGNRY